MKIKVQFTQLFTATEKWFCLAGNETYLTYYLVVWIANSLLDNYSINVGVNQYNSLKKYIT